MAGRILAAIVLLGLFGVPFFGQVAILLAFLVAGVVMLFWLFEALVRDLRRASRQGGFEVVDVVVGYSIAIAVVVLFLRYLVPRVLRALG
ncbi:MAG: hypothetical protein KDD11_08725 [Acidobacteria bacterium]|nr:hypothetical protein [Acidobacteriota bacterium]